MLNYNYNYYNIDTANDIIAHNPHVTYVYVYNLYTVTVYSKYSYPVYYAVNSRQGVTAEDPGEAEAKSSGRGTDSSNTAGELNGQTSNQVSHVCKSFINEFQKCSCMLDHMHGSEQPPVEWSSSNGEAVLSSDQLVNSYSRPLGTKYGTGVPDRLRVGATPTVYSKSSILFLRTNQPDKRGINETPPETGNPTVGTSNGGMVLVQHIPGSQEGQRAETSDS